MSVFPVQLTPLVASPGLKVYLNCDYPLGFNNAAPADTTVLSSWANLAGGLFICSQATGVSQPAYRANVNAGKSGIRFDGTNDAMDITTTSGSLASAILDPANPYTILISFRSIVLGATSRNLLSTRGDATTKKTYIGTSGSVNSIGVGVNNGSTINKTGSFTNTTSPHLITMTNNGAGTVVGALDGVTLSGSDTLATNGAVSAVTLGATQAFNLTYTANPWNGYIFDLLIYPGIVLDSGVLQNLSRYIANTRGISI